MEDIQKRYSIIDQQIALHFVEYRECLSNPIPIYATQSQRSQPITIKCRDFS